MTETSRTHGQLEEITKSVALTCVLQIASGRDEEISIRQAKQIVIEGVNVLAPMGSSSREIAEWEGQALLAFALAFHEWSSEIRGKISPQASRRFRRTGS